MNAGEITKSGSGKKSFSGKSWSRGANGPWAVVSRHAMRAWRSLIGRFIRLGRSSAFRWFSGRSPKSATAVASAEFRIGVRPVRAICRSAAWCKVLGAFFIGERSGDHTAAHTRYLRSQLSLAFRGPDPCMKKPSHPKNRKSGNQVSGSGKLNIS
jgi:hypothetical protein